MSRSSASATRRGRARSTGGSWSSSIPTRSPRPDPRTLRGVRVTVRLFAGLRERAGGSRREVEAARVGDVWQTLGLGDEPEGLLYAVNRDYAPRDQELNEGD